MKNSITDRHLHTRNTHLRRQHQQGFGIVELMVALALGLFLVGGAISVFVNNQQAYRTTEQLSRMQESGRTAVELMARQIREAGGNPCGSNLPTANVLNDADTYWWANSAEGIRGYDDEQDADGVDFGTSAGDRIADTDAVFLLFGDAGSGVRIVSHHPPEMAQIKVNTTAHGLSDGDIVMVCNYEHAAIMQLTSAQDANVTIVHNSGGSTSPGNCTKALGTPVVCNNTPAASWYEFKDGFLMKVVSEIWYVGANGRGGRSLYRARMVNNAGTPGAVTEEIAEGVTNLQMTYLELDAAGALPADYVDASAVSVWKNVTAVRLTLTLQSLQNVGTDGAPLQRTMTHVVSLRNRLP